MSIGVLEGCWDGILVPDTNDSLGMADGMVTKRKSSAILAFSN
jgi:hypothetical protein